ncbi:MAG TPA: TonB-dependent receptor [Candidatus Acidoferrum sp.]
MSLRPISLSLLVGIFLTTFVLNSLNAQTSTSGAVTGVVTDQSGAVVPNADVEIRDVNKGTTESTQTDRDGVYRFFFLSPSQYALTVVHDRFRQESRSVTVLLETPVTVNITLQIAKARTELFVTAEAPLVQADNGDVSSTMSQTQISELPNPGNDLTYIAQTAPGAIMATDNARTGGGGGNFSILGMPGTSNLFTVNGLNDNLGHLSFTSATGMLLGQNQIQEATVVSNGYSGHFGDAPGSFVNYVTKSGGNDFHGNAEYFWNGSVLNATDWITKAFGNPRPFDIANQWAGSVGGPIQKNRLFFFFDAEGLRVLLPSPVQVVLPSPQFEAANIANIDSIFGSASASDAFYKQMFSLYNETPGIAAATPGSFSDPLGCIDTSPSGVFIGPQTAQGQLGVNLPCAIHFQETIGQPTSESLVSGRIDWNIRTSDRAFFLLQYDNGRQPIVLDPVSPLFNVHYSGPWWQAQLNETHTFGTTAANQFLLAGTYQDGVTSVVNPAQTLAAFPTTLDWSDAGGPFTQLGGFDYVYGYPIGRGLTQYEIADDFLKIRGKHKFGFGGDFLRAYLSNSAYTQNAVGDVVPQTIDAFYSGGVDPATAQTDFTRLRQSFPTQFVQRFASYTLAGYAQDEWHAESNLTLTLVLRAEHESNPVCPHDCYAALSGSFESISHDPAQPYNQAISKRRQAFLHRDAVLWAPRFSVAWQPRGVSHNTVVRGGLGLFYELTGGFATYLSQNPPLVNHVSVSGAYNLAPAETNSLFKVAAASNAAFVEGFAAGDNLAEIEASDPLRFFPPSLIIATNHPGTPQYQKWSLEVQQTFGTHTSVTLGYYGNHGIHEFVQNPSANAYGWGPFPATVCASPPVPPCADSRFSGVTEYATPGISNYNGVVVSFRKKFAGFGNGLFQANYTYGHALDEVSNGGLAEFTAGSSDFPQDPFNLRGSYGPADYDVRHSLNANYVWQLPVKTMLHGRGPDFLVKGWQVAGTIFARTGFPYTVIDLAESGNLARNNFYGTIYSVPVAPLSGSHSCGAGAVVPPFPHPCWPPQLITLADGSEAPNPAALFVQTGCETGFNTGNMPGTQGPCSGSVVSFGQGRNRFRYPSYFNTDFTVMKKTSLVGDKVLLGIGVQFFNFFNHPNFGPPDNYSSDSSFGEVSTMEMPPTGILGSGLGGDVSPRMIQLKAQIRF